MSAFTVVKLRTNQVLLETDDWVAAQACYLEWHKSGSLRSVRGTHPSHQWDGQRPRRCTACGGWDNGSFGSQAPCGYDWGSDSLMSAVKRELAARS